MNQFALFAAPAPSIAGIDPRKGYASYSADVIGMQSKVRKPVSCNGDLWVCVGAGGSAVGALTLRFFRLMPTSEFQGETYTYNEKTSIWRECDTYPGDFARQDPDGFYHGMRVKSGSTSYILTGPELTMETTWALAETPYDPATDDEEEEDEEDERSGSLFGRDRDEEDEDLRIRRDYANGQLDGDEDDISTCDCGAELSQLDNHFILPCGVMCPECAAVHVGICDECAAEWEEPEVSYTPLAPAPAAYMPVAVPMPLFPAPVTLDLFGGVL